MHGRQHFDGILRLIDAVLADLEPVAQVTGPRRPHTPARPWAPGEAPEPGH